MTNDQAPIIVNTGSIPAGIGAALRYIVSLGLTYAAGAGLISNDDVPNILAAVMALAIAAYGVNKTRSRQSDLIVAAKAAPDSVADAPRNLS